MGAYKLLSHPGTRELTLQRCQRGFTGQRLEQACTYRSGHSSRRTGLRCIRANGPDCRTEALTKRGAWSLLGGFLTREQIQVVDRPVAVVGQVQRITDLAVRLNLVIANLARISYAKLDMGQGLPRWLGN